MASRKARGLAITGLGLAGLSEAHRNAVLYAIALTQGFPTSTDQRTKRVAWDVRARPGSQSKFVTFSERTGNADMHTDSSFYPMPEEQFLILQMHELLTYLNQRGIVTILILGLHGVLGDVRTDVDLSYLSDAILLFRFFEAHGHLLKAVSMVKSRTNRHEQTIREFQMGPQGLRVAEATLLSDAETPPFQIDEDDPVGEELKDGRARSAIPYLAALRRRRAVAASHPGRQDVRLRVRRRTVRDAPVSLPRHPAEATHPQGHVRRLHRRSARRARRSRRDDHDHERLRHRLRCRQ